LIARGGVEAVPRQGEQQDEPHKPDPRIPGRELRGYRFVLPGADIVGYRGDSGLGAADLAARYAFFTVTVPVQQTGLTCAGCSVVDQRLCLRGRQSSEEIRDMLHGHIFAHLFMRELLVRGPLGLRD